MRPRSDAFICAHDGSPSARLAAFTAASTSAAPAAPTFASVEPSAGLTTSKVLPSIGGAFLPSTKSGTTSEKRLRTRAGSITRRV
jgi:hypothetical protein